MGDIILRLENITKHFPGIKALDGVSLEIRAGEVHALLGENGAGKSTLVKILTGVYQPSSGVIEYLGQPVTFENAVVAQHMGISAIHQEASMFPELTVAENIFMGHHLKNGRGLPRLDWKEMHRRTSELLGRLDLDINPSSLVKSLGTAQRHMVEIAKALSIDARVVIMDEPTSALTLREVEDLYRITRQLRDEGKAIIFISHKFDEIFEISDSFSVLRDGQYIASGKIADHSVDQLVTMMVGRSLHQLFPKADAEIGEVVFKANDLCSEGVFNNINFELRRGEILGFFGLVGAGRSEVMRSIFGIDPLSSGTMEFEGKSYHPKSASDAMHSGFALVPEDRQTEGVILDMSIEQNISLSRLPSICKFGTLLRKKEHELAGEYGQKMEIRASGLGVAADTLSGGNQQKVVLAKWLATNPRILILDEPTKGIDVATKSAVHKFISDMACHGLAVMMISSELPEILGMSDRIVVMHEGEITAVFNRDEADSETIIKAATGHQTFHRQSDAEQGAVHA